MRKATHAELTYTVGHWVWKRGRNRINEGVVIVEVSMLCRDFGCLPLTFVWYWGSNFNMFVLEKGSWNDQDWIRTWKLIYSFAQIRFAVGHSVQSDSESQMVQWESKEWCLPAFIYWLFFQVSLLSLSLSFSCFFSVCLLHYTSTRINTDTWRPLKDLMQSLRISSRQIHFQRKCISLFNNTVGE